MCWPGPGAWQPGTALCVETAGGFLWLMSARSQPRRASAFGCRHNGYCAESLEPEVTMRRSLPRHAVAAALCTTVGFVAAQAQEPGARMTCESAAGRLRLDIWPEISPASAPQGRDVATYSRMVRHENYPTPGHEHDNWDSSEEPARDFVKRCTLLGARYVLTLRAHPFGTHALGRCGAALPSFDLSLTRDGQRLLDPLLLQDNCGDEGNAVGVTRVIADENSRAMSLSLIADGQFDAASGWPPRVDVVIPFDELRPTAGRSQREVILARVPRAPASGAQGAR